MRTSAEVVSPAPCTCGRWEWRELALASGLALHERTCPRCRRRMLLTYRNGQFMAAVEFTGRNIGSVAEAIEQVPGLRPEERAVLIAVAQRISEVGA